MIKDSEELQFIKKAVEIADGAFLNVLPLIKPGILETEVSAEIEYFMKKQGAQGSSSSLLKNCLPVFKRVQKSLSHASYFLIPIWLQHIVQLCSFLPQIRLSDLYISVLLQI
jgi:hypothetical protein